MTADTEKALLEFMETQARYFVGHYPPGEPKELTPVLDAARAYLATLEPKPEPKRGVEECLEQVSTEARLCAKAPEKWDTSIHAIVWARRAEEALRLYREERERVAKVAQRIRAYTDAVEPGVDLFLIWADELERRDG